MRYQEFILETAEENQIINLVATTMADRITDTLAANGGSPVTVSARKISPGVDSAELSQVLNKLKINLVNDPHEGENVDLGGYISANNTIKLNIPDIETYAKYKRKKFPDVLRSTLVHELQHALDDQKSSGAYTSGGAVRSSADDYEGYLNSPHEINARISEFLLDISEVIANWKKQNITVSNNDLTRLLKQKLSGNRLDKLEPQQLKRLYSRAYKFYSAEMESPKTVSADTLAAKAKKWIFGTGEGTIQ